MAITRFRNRELCSGSQICCLSLRHLPYMLTSTQGLQSAMTAVEYKGSEPERSHPQLGYGNPREKIGQPYEQPSPPPYEPPACEPYRQPAGQPYGQAYGQPYGQAYGQPYGLQHGQQYRQPGAYGPNAMVVTTQPNVKVVQPGLPPPNNNMVLAIVACIFCFFPLGMFAILFSCQSSDAARAGDIQTARCKARISMGLSVSAIITAVLAVVVFGVFYYKFTQA